MGIKGKNDRMVVLACEDCKERNYTTVKNKKNVKPGTMKITFEYWNAGHTFNHVNMLSESAVTIVNDLTKITEFPNNINYDYYLKECNKIIKEFAYKQLSLF